MVWGGQLVSMDDREQFEHILYCACTNTFQTPETYSFCYVGCIACGCLFFFLRRKTEAVQNL